MNKINKLFAGFAAVAMLAACSNDEPTPAPNPGDENGEKAYMSIRIQAATGMSRSTTDGNFEDGNEDEHAVKNVRFFFFDAQGAAMDLQAYLVGTSDNITVTPNNPAGTGNNVEAVFGENILVLEKLTSNNYPNYMITVLNRPGFECGTTLSNTLERLSTYKEGDYYVMSTASYAGENAHHDNTYYHATKLQPTDFKPTAEAATTDGSTVSVYVERLAAKVQVGMAETMNSTVKDLGNGRKIYKLDQTVANGGDNTELDPTDKPGELGTDLWIEVLGWDLNTTVNDSYMCKNIDTEWTFDWGANGEWNASGLFRSYWSKSTIYDMTLTQATAANKLSYVHTMTWKEAAASKTLKDLGNNVFAYCNENTNKPERIFETEPNDNARALIDSRIVTNVVLYAQICDENGEKLDDLVMANGVLFRSNSYLQYVINRAYAMTTALNIWEKTSDTTTSTPDGDLNKKEYQQIGTGYFELVYPTSGYDGVGDVDVKVKDNAFDGKDLYTKNAAGGYDLLEGDARATAIAALENAIATVQPQGENHAVMYENGKSVYYIPVQHLGAIEGKTTVDECYYGVVRNHWYKLTISKFTKVGHGIWDPEEGRDETLKPDKPENPLYYLGADINILAWKVVNQNVEL